MKRWEQLYVELERKAAKLGYDPPMPIGSGNSQTYEYRVNRKPVLIVSFRDVGRKKDYAHPDRLWVEGLDLVLKRFLELAEQNPEKTLPAAIAIVIDNIGGSYVVVTLNELLDLYQERMKEPHAKGSRQFTFHVERRDSGYFLVMPQNRPNVPLVHVDSMGSVVALLKELRS